MYTVGVFFCMVGRVDKDVGRPGLCAVYCCAQDERAKFFRARVVSDERNKHESAVYHENPACYLIFRSANQQGDLPM